jgi:ketosteroid isomerase-like protein
MFPFTRSNSTHSVKDIQNQEAKLLEAMKRHDLQALDCLLHDDLLFIAPDGQTVTKEMDLDAHRSGSMIIERIESTIEQISLIGDSAVVVVVLDTKGSMLGNPIEGKFRYIRVWKQFGAEQKVIAGSCTKI